MTAHTRRDIEQLLSYLDDVCRSSPHTLRAYRTGLDQYAAFLKRRRCTARTADMRDVIAYAATLRGKQPATAALRLAAVRRLHSYLHALGHVERDAAALVPSPRRDRGRRPAPAPHRVHAAYMTLRSPRDRAIFSLLYSCALRISEARLALAVDVNLDDRTVTVLGKGRAWRTVELDEHARADLSTWLRARGTRRNPYLFPAARGADRPISETPIRRMLRRAATDAGLDPADWTPHALRRSRGRALRAAGADPFAVQAIYGHASLAQTSHYVGDDVAQLPDVVRERLAHLQRARTS